MISCWSYTNVFETTTGVPEDKVIKIVRFYVREDKHSVWTLALTIIFLFIGIPSSSKVRMLEVNPIISITFTEYNNKVVKLEPEVDNIVVPLTVTFLR